MRVLKIKNMIINPNHHSAKMPIPRLKSHDWDQVRLKKINESGEELVPASLIPERILVRPQYYFQGIPQALPECYARKSVVSRLVNASLKLPRGYKLVILDSWRPLALQQSLFDTFIKELEKQHPDKTNLEIQTMATAFVARPSNNGNSPSPHLTGGAVDLTLAADQGILLDMGTEFDATCTKSQTRYFEEKLEMKEHLSPNQEIQAQNRRLLFHVMAETGFTNYPNEWWHFDYGNQNWAFMSQEEHPSAIYGTIDQKNRWR
jgi:D-alanyl-D-alanine dipeptidase